MNHVNQIAPEGYYPLEPAGYSHTPPQEEKEIHLRDYWKVFLKRRWMNYYYGNEKRKKELPLSS